MRSKQPPSLKARQKFNVNRKGEKETVWYPLYDYAAYPTAGISSLTFFQTPVGQAGKTFEDTNMVSAGSLPTPQSFLITGIQVLFFPGVSPGAFGAPAGDTPFNFINDQYDLFKSGFGKLFIGSKDYSVCAPIGMYPSQFRMGGFGAAADASTAGPNLNTQMGYASFAGPEFRIGDLNIPANQNFNMSLNWPTIVATPSGQDGRIGVALNGWLTRLSQ
jgi:hypothetical protein